MPKLPERLRPCVNGFRFITKKRPVFKPVFFFERVALVGLEVLDRQAAERFVAERLAAEFLGIGFDLVSLPFGENLDDLAVSADFFPLSLFIDFGEVEIFLAKRLCDADDALVFCFDDFGALFVGNAAEIVLLDQKSFRRNDDVLSRADNGGRLGIDVDRQLVAFLDAEVSVLVNQEILRGAEKLVAGERVDSCFNAVEAEKGTVLAADCRVCSVDDGLICLDLRAGCRVSDLLDTGENRLIGFGRVGVQIGSVNRSRYRLVTAARYHQNSGCQNKELFHFGKN